MNDREAITGRAIAKHTDPTIGETLETALEDLRKYGNPRLYFTGNNWYCSVDMHVTSAGTTFKVDSDFKQGTPMDAVRQCRARIIETLKLYKDVK